MSEEYSMRPLITSKQKHLLWKDELGDDFLLLKYGEVFKYAKNELRVHSWLKSARNKVVKLGLILSEFETDDPLWVFNTEASNLSALIALGAHKQRPHLKGNWLNLAEKKLAHKIFPFRCEEYWKKKEIMEKDNA